MSDFDFPIQLGAAEYMILYLMGFEYSIPCFSFPNNNSDGNSNKNSYHLFSAYYMTDTLHDYLHNPMM